MTAKPNNPAMRKTVSLEDYALVAGVSHWVRDGIGLFSTE